MAAPKTLPWPVIAILLATILGAAGLAALITPAAALPALVGAATGIAGAFLSPDSAPVTPTGTPTGAAPRRTPFDRGLLPLLLGLAAIALLLLGPPVPVLWATGLALCIVAGCEAALTGGRMGVMVIAAWLTLLIIAQMPPPAISVPASAAGLVAGWAMAALTGIAGKAARPPGPPLHGLILALYLAIGLAVSTLVMHHLHSPYAHWIAMIFVMRALAPPHMSTMATLRFGLGAIGGCLAALALIALSLPHVILIGLGLLAITAGLRLVPHPQPWTPAAFSAAVLLLVAPDAHDALFRLEAVVFVVFLSAGLSIALGLALDPNGLRRTRPAT